MHTKNIRNNTVSSFFYLCLGTNITAFLFASISFWVKPALGTINQDNYLSEISLNTYNSKHTASASNLSINPNLKISLKQTEAEKAQLKPVALSSELLIGHKVNEGKIAEPVSCCDIDKSQKIAQTDSSEVIGDTLGEANKLRQELLIDPITVNVATFNGAPGSTAGTPSAYGASWGQAYVGGGLFFPLDKGRTDGSLSVGFGLGDAVKSVGVEVNANITSVGGGNSNFDFGDSGSLGFKVHKYLGDGAAVAVGFSNPVTWGDSNNAKDTIYGVATKSFNLQPNNPDNKMPLTISLGVGSGSFRSKGAIVSGENPANIFGSIGIRTAPQVAWVSSWTGNRLNIGGSFAPFKQTPIVINAIFTDVTNNFDDGLGISLSAGYAIRF
ncbi:hypothetical protein [Rivularia sp. UHCC 0363]|uniref:hypothetical protein n=1 Tax=Rivularia sp. UHCC 0363 TaxID=3110244 RepID=UPI002B21DC9A|nr:hypothetical protein [Rivularia sp. UHCC 0363]MEA5593494.1 hypothetical protein [Rivularia sp. UHCC 0363]